MVKKSTHPQWALDHKKPGTEFKLLYGRYYLYKVKSVYDKTRKRSKKVSGSILGNIRENANNYYLNFLGFEFNTDWIFVIVQLAFWPKRLSIWYYILYLYSFNSQ
jgi:hypothetical protein